MHPVLKEVKQTQPAVKTIHLWSDGPTTQYRNKHQLLLSSFHAPDAGFESVMWNYFEVGHGKSVVDSVGGSLKQTADAAINQGTSITTAEKFYAVVGEETNIKLFLIVEEDIDLTFRSIPEGFKSLTDTMKMHQSQIIERGQIVARDFSCFCEFPAVCECYNSRQVIFLPFMEPVIQATGDEATDVETQNTGSWCG